jgi:low affinity Fe/Cu permease
MRISDQFSRFANGVSWAAGKPLVFILALSFILVWAISGPLFGFSQQWQLVVNTATTIITFLMVFVLQNTQNRDGQALHAKLDELILVGKAENGFIEAEQLSEKEIQHLRELIERERDRAAAQGAGRGHAVQDS